MKCCVLAEFFDKYRAKVVPVAILLFAFVLSGFLFFGQNYLPKERVESFFAGNILMAVVLSFIGYRTLRGLAPLPGKSLKGPWLTLISWFVIAALTTAVWFFVRLLSPSDTPNWRALLFVLYMVACACWLIFLCLPVHRRKNARDTSSDPEPQG